MHLKQETIEPILNEEFVEYKFVVNEDLAYVGGGSAVLDY